MDYIDKATPVRSGEELDSARIESFLKDSIPGLEGQMTITQFPGGASNLTYCIAFAGRELVLRRPPFGKKAKTAHDMNREYRILNALKEVYPYCPKPLVYTDDAAVMGCPFYVMDRIRGIIVRRDFPPGLFSSSGQVRDLFHKLLGIQYALHAVDYERLGLGNFGKPKGYVERQVLGWSRRYRDAHTPDVPDCENVMSWLAARMPPDSKKPGLVHNDFKLDNVILDPQNPSEIIGVLDWEMATLGEPLMDLGSSLGYWVEADDPPEMQAFRTAPTHAPGAPTRREIFLRYQEMSGCTADDFDFYHCFGLFRLAVIVQQIYYRYTHGQTRDERFSVFGQMATALEKAAVRIIDK